jgi:hypothetical protein
VDDLTNLASAYGWFIRRSLQNGLGEIQLGLFGLMMGAMFLVAPSQRPWGRIFPFVFMAFPGTILWAGKKINEAFVVPRTGYFVFRRTESDLWRETWILAGALVALTMLLVASMLYFPSVWNVSGPLSALVIAAGFVWARRFFRFPHLNWLAGFSLLLGAVTYAAGVRELGLVWMMPGVGAALVVSGAVRFRIFLNTHPVIQEEQ